MHSAGRKVLPASALAAAAAAAAAGGAFTAQRPTLAVATVAATLSVAVLVAVPLRYMAALAVVGVALVPSVIIEGTSHAALTRTPFNGQARLLACVVVVVLIKLVADKSRVPLMAPATTAIVLYVTWTLFTALIAYFRGNGYNGLPGDALRQISYVCAFVVGAAAASEACRAGRVLSLVRSLALVSLMVSSASVAYWGWIALHLPLTNSLFREVAATSVYHTRSVFPFVQDSPNLGAVADVALAGMAILPLLAGSYRDRRLAVVTAIACLASVFATESRTGIVALAAAALVLLATTRSYVARRRIVAVVLALALIGGGAYTFFPQNRQLSTHATTLLARESIWHQAAGKVAASLFVGQGFGYSQRGNFTEVLPPGPYVLITSRPQSVHGDFIGAAVDGGLIGLGVLVAVLVMLVKVGRVGLRAGSERAFAAGFLSSLAAIAVSMTGDSVLPSAVNAILLWLFTGLLVGVIRSPSQAPRRATPRRPDRFAVAWDGR